MLQSISSVFIVYRHKTLTGSPDPMHANSTDKFAQRSRIRSVSTVNYGNSMQKHHVNYQESPGYHRMKQLARACNVYRPCIRDVLQQVDAIMTIFVMEKELRSIKGRGHFPIPTITPHDTRIENLHQVRKTLEAFDEEKVQILTTVRENERNYEKEKE